MTSYPCPACRASANLTFGCSGCGRAPDPEAAEVIRLDGEIVVLTGRTSEAQRTYLGLAAALRDTRRRRDDLAARVRARAYVQQPIDSGAAAPLSAPGRIVVPQARATGPGTVEASPRTVQNLLFILGGLLLGTAAIVFTAVAWSTFGVVGRAAILAAVTMVALAVPPVAKRRGLVATAETFAAVGVLLVVLDGYAAWTVDLFGVAGWPGYRYAALVAAVATTVAVGYGRATRLAAPWFAGLLLVQSVGPLLAADAERGVAGWALTFAALAGANLAVVWRAAGGGMVRVGRIVAWTAYGTALLLAGLCALAKTVTAAVAGTEPVLSGVPLVVAALLLAAGAVLARRPVFQAVAGAVLVVVLAIVAVRPVAELPRSLRFAAIAAAMTLLSGVVALAVRRLPPAVRPGPTVGGLLVGGALTMLTGTMTGVVAVATAVGSLPVWRADVTRPVRLFDWQLPAAVLLATVALAVLVPRPGRRLVVLAGGVAVVFAAPSAVPVPWWAVSVLDLVAGVSLLFGAVLSPSRRSWIFRRVLSAISPEKPETVGPLTAVLAAASGAVLTGHAIVVSLARPTSAALILAAVLLAGLAVAAVVSATAAVAGPVVTAGRGHRTAIGGVALAWAALAGVAAGGVGLLAAGAPPEWQGRATLGATVLLVGALAAIRRRWPAYLPYAAVAQAVATLLVGLAPGLWATDEWPGTYAAMAALLLVLSMPLLRAPAAASPGASSRASSGTVLVAMVIAAGSLLLRAAVEVVPAVWAVLVGPYGWLSAIWSGAPRGVGLAPAGTRPGWLAGTHPESREVVALAILAVVAAATVVARRGRPTSVARWLAVVGTGTLPVGMVALLAGLAASGARWPTVPAVALTVGLACLLVAALANGSALPHQRLDMPSGPLLSATGPLVTGTGLLLTGAGLAGALPTKAGTLAGLGLVTMVAGTAGGVGRTSSARVVGWLAAVSSGTLLAVCAALAAELPLRAAAFGVLVVAAAALVVGALRRGRPESVAVEMAGQVTAVIALLLTLGDIRYAAMVCTLWGIVVGARALWPGEPARRRWGLTAGAAGSELLAGWLLLAAEEVAVLEAYTLPAAALTVVAGWLAVRARTVRSSWVAYGPGLTAALLPTLATVLVTSGSPGRRLALGVGALGVVLAGARWRRQAPVLLGGGTLTILALHEVVGIWDRYPRWIFLAVGGLVLISLAMTYERRRRDLARLRETVGRLT